MNKSKVYYYLFLRMINTRTELIESIETMNARCDIPWQRIGSVALCVAQQQDSIIFTDAFIKSRVQKLATYGMAIRINGFMFPLIPPYAHLRRFLECLSIATPKQ